MQTHRLARQREAERQYKQSGGQADTNRQILDADAQADRQVNIL